MVAGLRGDMKNITMPTVDSGGLERSLVSLKSKMQSLHIADIADVNINPGLIMTQLNLLKRLIGQAGINDILDINVSSASLTKAMARISNLSADVPVNFDVSGLSALKSSLASGVHGLTVPVKYEVKGGPDLPAMGDTIPVHFKPDIAALNTVLRKISSTEEKIPVKFEIGAMPDLPTLGHVEGIKPGSLGIDAATLASWASLNNETYKLQAGLGDLRPLLVGAAIQLQRGGFYAKAFGQAVASQLNPQLLGARMALNAVRDTAVSAERGFSNSMAGFRMSVVRSSMALQDQAKLVNLTIGRWGFARGQIQLFGGALASIGVPVGVAVGGMHLLVDTLFETAAVGIPAIVGLTAVMIGSIGSVQDYVRSMTALWTTTHALNQNIYPLTGNMFKLEEAIQPTTMQIFGDMLYITDQKAAAFNKTALESSRVVQQLFTRMTVAITSGGLDKFMANASKDLAGIGDIIGNMFGIIGNALRVVPGYAEMLLGGLDGLTKGLEAVTGSGFGQWVLGVGLSVHGAMIWFGLAATAAVWLGNSLVGLAAKFGLASEGALAFNAIQFGSGVKMMAGSFLNLGSALFIMRDAELAGAAGAGILKGAMIALDAVNPMIWVGLAAAGLGYLIYNLTRARTFTNEYASATQKAMENVPVTQLGINLTRQQSIAMSTLKTVQQQLAVMTPGFSKAWKELWTGGHIDASQQQQIKNVTQLWTTQSDAKALLPILNQDMRNYSTVLKAAGGNVSLLNDAGITSNDIITASGEKLKQLVVEAAAAAAAQRALALGTGEAAAAQNAQTNIFMQETVPAMQKVIKSEDELLNVVLGGRQAFDSFQQSIIGTTAKFKNPSGLADAFKFAKGDLTGLNEQSLAYANTLYGISIPALQKTIDAVRTQGIDQKSLTRIVATGSGEILKYTGHNVEARAVMVSLINNALGPGTVSLKNLNTWVRSNSTSLQGFSADIAKSTIKAGSFANVLQNDLNAQFAHMLLLSSGATSDMKLLTDAIVHGGTQTEAYKGARKRLIDDLISTGMNAKDAKSFVDKLQTSINSMHGKNVPVGVHAQANGAISIVGSGWAAGQGNIRFHAAQGGIVPADMGVQGQDSVMVMTKPGEIFIPPEKGPILAPYLKRAGIPGFASGGQVDPFGNIRSQLGGIADFPNQQQATDSDRAIKAGVDEALRAAKAAVAAAAAAAGGGAGSGNDIVSFAESFLGKIPYVWGGTSLSARGADCSGFTGSVYKHFGYNPPRSSEQQGFWVNHTSQPQKGGLAFYHSPPGGADPGHVAIVAGNGQVVSQGGGMGPKMESLNFLPLLWTGVPPGGFKSSTSAPGVNGAQTWMRAHLGDYGWGQNQWPSLLSLWQGESGWRWNAQNPSSGAYGIPQSLPGSKMATVGSDWRTNPVTQMRWGAEYIRGVYGSPFVAYGDWLMRSPHWYAQGGVVPGNVAKDGAAYLKAWRTRHGGGFGAAWGPIVVNEQIDLMQDRLSHDSTLAHAGGLSNKQRAHWSFMAADDKRRLSTLNKELGTERSWRSALGTSDKQLSRWIHAAGNNPSLSRNVRGWKSQLGKQKATIGNISNMLGWSNEHLAAFPPQPPVTHTYGGDVANTTGAFLQSVLNPFTGVSMDRGGWLKPGWNPPMYNGTGAPERVGGTGCVTVNLVIDDAGSAAFDQFLHMAIRKHVKIKGGGSVQRAYGIRGSV